MTLSRIFFVVAAVLFFFAAIAAPLIPNPTAWGLFFTALGLAASGVAYSSGRVVVS